MTLEDAGSLPVYHPRVYLDTEKFMCLHRIMVLRWFCNPVIAVRARVKAPNYRAVGRAVDGDGLLTRRMNNPTLVRIQYCPPNLYVALNGKARHWVVVVWNNYPVGSNPARTKLFYWRDKPS